MKLFKTDDSQGSIKSSALNTMFEWLIQGLGEERHKFTVAEDHGYKETNRQYEFRTVVSKVSSCAGNSVVKTD